VEGRLVLRTLTNGIRTAFTSTATKDLLRLSVELGMRRLDEHDIAGLVHSTSRPVVVMRPSPIGGRSKGDDHPHPEEIARPTGGAHDDQTEPEHQKKQRGEVASIPRPPHRFVHGQQHCQARAPRQSAKNWHHSRHPEQPQLPIPSNRSNTYSSVGADPRQHASVGVPFSVLINNTQHRPSHYRTNRIIARQLSTRRCTLVVILFVSLVASCGTASKTTTTAIDRWFATTRALVSQDKPIDDILQLDPNENCDLVDDIEIAGKRLEPFGAATAQFGNIGDRYQCAWSGDTNTSANVRLEVVIIDDPADFNDYAELISTRDGNTVVSTGIGDVQVAEYRPSPTGPPLTTSILVDATHLGGIHLVVELLDSTLRFTPVDHARLLETLASSG
jgi:hypothetical protein